MKRCVFRGWPYEVMTVVEKLNAIGITAELKETLVSSPLGGVFLSELFVLPSDVPAARKILGVRVDD